MCGAFRQSQQRNILEEQELLVLRDRTYYAQLQQAELYVCIHVSSPLLSVQLQLYHTQQHQNCRGLRLGA
jgi:hypothetical protein